MAEVDIDELCDKLAKNVSMEGPGPEFSQVLVELVRHALIDLHRIANAMERLDRIRT